ncbi:hypothetical protein P9112_007684 [Eukaryota sp. TZLM1-RC]
MPPNPPELSATSSLSSSLPSDVEPPLKKKHMSRFDYIFTIAFQLPLSDLEFFSHRGSGTVCMSRFFQEAFGLTFEDKFTINNQEMNVKTTHYRYLRDLINFCASHPSFQELETFLVIRQDLRDNSSVALLWRSSVPEGELVQFVKDQGFIDDFVIVKYDDEVGFDAAQKELTSKYLSNADDRTTEDKDSITRKKKSGNYCFWFFWRHKGGKLLHTSLKSNGPPAVRKFFRDAFQYEFKDKKLSLNGVDFSIKTNNLQYLIDFCSFAANYEPFNNLEVFLIIRENSDASLFNSLLYKGKEHLSEIVSYLESVAAPNDNIHDVGGNLLG